MAKIFDNFIIPKYDELTIYMGGCVQHIHTLAAFDVGGSKIHFFDSLKEL